MSIVLHPSGDLLHEEGQTRFISTEIADVIFIETKQFGDNRGWFQEFYRSGRYAKGLNASLDCVQMNFATNELRGTIRGLHFQKNPHGQAKLVWVTSGRILDVAVDIRTHSPTFGKYVARELSRDEHNQLFIPIGFAHGYIALEDRTDVAYAVFGGEYASQAEGGLNPYDAAVRIDWRMPREEHIGDERGRDISWPPLGELKDLF